MAWASVLTRNPPNQQQTTSVVIMYYLEVIAPGAKAEAEATAATRAAILSIVFLVRDEADKGVILCNQKCF
jgi:hypothetical protein